MTKASILFASSEVVGYAKTGGLGDVCGSLPRAVAELGHRCAVIMPLYHSARHGSIPVEPTEITFSVPFDGATHPIRLWKSHLPDQPQVPLWLIEHPEFYERDTPDNRGGFYTQTHPDGTRSDYPDNWARFGFLCRAILESLPYLDWWPDVIHANDWQTGLVPVYLRELFRKRPGYSSTRSLFTIHNLAYQGVFPAEVLPRLGLDWNTFHLDGLEFYGQVSFLKGGLMFADRITTVSPTYAREIQTKYFGCGLQGALWERRMRLSGIVNGIDQSIWNAASDPHLPRNYSIDDFVAGKAICKRELQAELSLPRSPDVPLFGVVARLAHQKGIDLILGMADELLAGLDPVQMVILGTGEEIYEEKLAELSLRYPDRVAFRRTYDEGLAHRIEAGSDLFLMPSLYEPCGLNQLYSLRYGTPPVVRATGGLVDTVTDATDLHLEQGTATGFCFVTPSSAALLEATKRAVTMYQDRPEQFRQMIRVGMAQDWSWQRSAEQYADLYQRLLSERDARELAGHRGRPR